MARSSTNPVSASSGTSDWIEVRSGQSVTFSCTNWNSASVTPWYMVNEDTTVAHTIKASLGGSALSIAANETIVLDGSGYVYFVVTGSPSAAVQMLVHS